MTTIGDPVIVLRREVVALHLCIGRHDLSSHHALFDDPLTTLAKQVTLHVFWVAKTEAKLLPPEIPLGGVLLSALLQVCRREAAVTAVLLLQGVVIDIEHCRDDGTKEGHHNVEEHELGQLRGEHSHSVNRLSEADSRVEAPAGALTKHLADLHDKEHHETLNDSVHFG